MKRFFLVITLMILLVWGCSHKTVPAKTETSSIAMTTSGDAIEGKATFTEKCGRCHGLKDPANYTVAQWGPILSSMAIKAKLDDTEKANVMAYVQANAKQ